MSKFTDNMISQLYVGLARDYQALKATNDDPQYLYEQLYSRLHFAMENPLSKSNLKYLDQSEKEKAWKVFHVFFNSCPQIHIIPPEQRVQYYKPLATVVVVDSSYHHYCHRNDSLFNWMMLGMLMSHSHSGHGHGHFPGGSHRHGHGDSNGNAFIYMILMALLILAATAAFLASFFMFSEFLNSMERFCYSEGWMRAGITIAGTLGGLTAGALLGTFIVSPILISLALAAGISNPLGIAITGIICMTLISGAIACGITNCLQNSSIEEKNPDALDPKDPHRFALTEREKEALLEKNIDPTVVKCAIAALRKKMSELDGGSAKVPSFLYRHVTCKGREIQHLLKQVRQLRAGELEDGIQVDDNYFDLKLQPIYHAHFSNQQIFTSQPGGQPSAHISQSIYGGISASIPSAPQAASGDLEPLLYPSLYSYSGQTPVY